VESPLSWIEIDKSILISFNSLNVLNLRTGKKLTENQILMIAWQLYVYWEKFSPDKIQENKEKDNNFSKSDVIPIKLLKKMNEHINRFQANILTGSYK